MISKIEAQKVVLSFLNKNVRNKEEELSIIESLTIEKPYGWVFFYQSKKFNDTGIEDYMIFGTGPIIVTKDDGKMFTFGSARPSDQYILDFEMKYYKRIE